MPFILEIELKGARLKGHDHYWNVIRELGAAGAEFTIAEVVRETAGHKDSVGDFVRRLTRTVPPIAEAVGWRQVRNPNWKPGSFVKARTYRLLLTPHETPSVRRSGEDGSYGRVRQHMWNILRGPQARSGIAANEMVMLAETEEFPISLGTAKEFLRKLEAAGYLVVDQVAANNRLTRYRLRPSMNTGPKAPKLLKTELVYDPNRKTVVGAALAEEGSR